MIKHRVSKLEKEANSLRNKFRLIMVILVVLMVINIGYFIPNQITSIQKQFTQNIVTTSTTSEPKTNIITNNYSQANINTFYDNSAISQIGFQLDLKKQSVSTKDAINCFTATVPSIANGCGFEIRPFASTIPAIGTRLINIVFKAAMGQDDKIVLDLKNSETGEIISNLGTIEGKFKELSLKLPNTLSQKEQILVRLWPRSGSEITINNISIEYLDIAKLKPVELKLTQEDVKKYVGKSLSVYLDVDKNAILEKSIDQQWICKGNFPGVKPLIIKEDGVIKLERDDECIKENIPSSWKFDLGLNALPLYHWLAVIKVDESKNDVLAFQTSNEKEQYEIGK
jgi:hypothetical protein